MKAIVKNARVTNDKKGISFGAGETVTDKDFTKKTLQHWHKRGIVEIIKEDK